MDNNSHKSNMPKFEVVRQIVSIITNFAVIIGIFFAFSQLKQTNELEKRRIAVEAVNTTISAEFLDAYTKLMTIYKNQELKNNNKIDYIKELNYVINVFNNISILYVNDLADKYIIHKSIYTFVSDFAPALDYLIEPFKLYNNTFREPFDNLNKLLKEHSIKKN